MDMLHAGGGSCNPMQALCFSNEASEGGLLSIESHRSVPAPFLTKTYQLVDDPTTDHIVSWGEDESTFVVWRPPEFARDLLPNYFKHNNFSSFVRQLNTYGFRKIVPDRWEFANEFFRKGEKHLLCEIHRRKTAQNNRSSPTNSSEDLMMQQQGAVAPWSPLSSPMESPRGAAFAVAAAHHASMQQQAAAAAAVAHNMTHMSNMGAGCALSLSDENERLRRDNTLLLSELTRMKKLYHEVLLYVQHQNLQQVQSARAACGSNVQASTETPSSQACSFHIPSSHRSLVYHSPSPCNFNGVMKSNMDSPSTRLSTAAESCRSSDNAPAIPFAVPVSTHALAANMGRTDTHNSYCNMDAKNLRSAAASTLSIATSNNQPAENDDAAGGAGADEKSPPKLFGVPLNLSKKRTHQDDNSACNELVLGDGSLSKSSVASLNILKSAKTSELALELKQPISSSMHAPWLKFNASRDEQVYN
eukprot:c23080_g1_i1 orf=222-1643(+)